MPKHPWNKELSIYAATKRNTSCFFFLLARAVSNFVKAVTIVLQIR